MTLPWFAWAVWITVMDFVLMYLAYQCQDRLERARLRREDMLTGRVDKIRSARHASLQFATVFQLKKLRIRVHRVVLLWWIMSPEFLRACQDPVTYLWVWPPLDLGDQQHAHKKHPSFKAHKDCTENHQQILLLFSMVKREINHQRLYTTGILGHLSG